MSKDFDSHKENMDEEKKIVLELNGFLFAACCLRQSFEDDKELRKMVELKENFGKSRYKKEKRDFENRKLPQTAPNKLKFMLVDDHRCGRRPVINWGDEKAGSKKKINFRLDVQNSSGIDINVSIQAGEESIATVLFARKFCDYHDMARHNLLREICDALLKSLEATASTPGVVKLLKRYRVKEKG